MESLLIRPLLESDMDAFAKAFRAQGWTPKPEVHRRYLLEQEKGLRRVFVAETNGVPAGYLTLVPKAETGPFAGKEWPEIQDFNVLKAYQRRGIGSALMDAAEEAASRLSDTVTLGVGLHSGYGPAQRLYIRRGYLPDGSGVWFQDQPAKPYAPCQNDNSLVLYLSKKLR